MATFAGTVEGGRLGDQVAAGDLDGDGQAELLTGAAMVYGTSTFHAFRGRRRLASDSEWTSTARTGSSGSASTWWSDAGTRPWAHGTAASRCAVCNTEILRELREVRWTWLKEVRPNCTP